MTWSVSLPCVHPQPGSSSCLVPAVHDLHDGPCGAVVGLFTRLRNRPNRPFQPNDSVQFQEKFPDNHPEHSDWAEFAGLLNFIGEIGHDAEERWNQKPAVDRFSHGATAAYLPFFLDSLEFRV